MITKPLLADRKTDIQSWDHPASKMDSGNWIQSYVHNYWDPLKFVEDV